MRAAHISIIVLLMSLFTCLATTGCGAQRIGFETGNKAPEMDTEEGRELARKKLKAAADAVGWIAGICVLISIATLAASAFFPLVPRKAAMLSLGVALLLYALQWAMYVYGEVFAEILIWVSVSVLVFMGVCAGVPWVLAWKNHLMLKTAKELAQKETPHLDAAVALEATAMPSKFPTSESRKQRLQELKESRGI